MRTQTRIVLFFILCALIPSAFAMDPEAVPGAKELGHFHSVFHPIEKFFVFRVIISFVLGLIIGTSHDLRYKGMVGKKTYGAVCLGAAAFAGLATHVYLLTGQGNSLQNIGTVTSGIGFLCAAVIFKEGLSVRGLATAATIWTTAAVGVACGEGLFGAAVVISIFIMILHALPKHKMQEVE